MYTKPEIIEMILRQYPSIDNERVIARLMHVSDDELKLMFEKSSGAILEKIHNNYLIKYN